MKRWVYESIFFGSWRVLRYMSVCDHYVDVRNITHIKPLIEEKSLTWPELFSPQLHSLPFTVTATVKLDPQAIDLIRLRPTERILGAIWGLCAPNPCWPRKPSPQEKISPFEQRAMECVSLATTSCTTKKILSSRR